MRRHFLRALPRVDLLLGPTVKALPVSWWHDRDRTIGMFRQTIAIVEKPGGEYSVTYHEPMDGWQRALWFSIQPFDVRLT